MKLIFYKIIKSIFKFLLLLTIILIIFAIIILTCFQVRFFIKYITDFIFNSSTVMEDNNIDNLSASASGLGHEEDENKIFKYLTYYLISIISISIVSYIFYYNIDFNTITTNISTFFSSFI
jgi:hypothetical protein